MLSRLAVLCIVSSLVCSATAYVLTPTSGSRVGPSVGLRRAPATSSSTFRQRALGMASLRMDSSGDSTNRDESEGEHQTDALVTPPTEFGRTPTTNNLLPGSTQNNMDFVSELVLGKLPKDSDNVPEDGDFQSEPISVPVGGDTVELGAVVRPMMSMIFTCNVCETRQMKSFTKLAYEKGIVVVTCKGCGAKHLIADNLGWYRDWLQKGDQNVQDIMRRKGIEVPRIDGEDARMLYEEWKE